MYHPREQNKLFIQFIYMGRRIKQPEANEY